MIVTPTEPLPLHHSWPIVDAEQRFDLGYLFDGAGECATVASSPLQPLGHWSCALADNALTWSTAVYRLFGLPDEGPPRRMATVAMYAERSRAAMERLRAYAIRHRRGFTLDVAIHPADAAQRWVRIVAAPVVAGGEVVMLRGCKADVSALYR